MARGVVDDDDEDPEENTGDPETATLSGYIKAWRRKKPGRSWLLGAVIVGLVLIPIYLFAHLVLEVI